ncbi:hypothetical protein LXA43DRAFT_1013071 [Ganoderma leucocontextum]|nr:hypothetical protein LXA43DRAFT_1013071 [Ganoderma leucocontextum]
METGGFIGFPGDGTIHISCLAGAPHELLMRSQNGAYIAAMQKIEGLSRHIQYLEGELGGQKQAFEGMVNKVPILLGITNMQNPAADDPSAVLDEQGHRSCASKVVLGLGMAYPAALDAPPQGVHLKYWSKKSFSGRTVKPGKKTGQHKPDKNVGQLWIEDETGNIIPGYVAHSIREILTSCFHSLAWTGQAMAHSRELGHEARVYIHNILGGHFPFLLICEGGRWKINELITHAYSGFAGTHLNKKKRARSESTTSDSETEAPRAKAPKQAAESQPSHATPSSPSPEPWSIDSSNSSSHPLLDPNIALFTIQDHEDTGMDPVSVTTSPPAASVDIPPPPVLPSSPQPTTSTHATVAQNASTHIGPEGVEQVHYQPASGDSQRMNGTSLSLQEQRDNLPNIVRAPEAPARNVTNSPTPPTTTTSDTPHVGALPQIPIPKPFAVTTRSRAPTTQTAQPESEVLTATVPEPSHTTDRPLDSDGDVTTSEPATVTTSQQGRRRGPVKAADKRNPNTISIQSFHMRDQIKENPDILYTEWQQLFAALGPAQRKVYQDEVTRARRERKGKDCAVS